MLGEAQRTTPKDVVLGYLCFFGSKKVLINLLCIPFPPDRSKHVFLWIQGLIPITDGT